MKIKRLLCTTSNRVQQSSIRLGHVDSLPTLKVFECEMCLGLFFGFRGKINLRYRTVTHPAGSESLHHRGMHGTALIAWVVGVWASLGFQEPCRRFERRNHEGTTFSAQLPPPLSHTLKWVARHFRVALGGDSIAIDRRASREVSSESGGVRCDECFNSSPGQATRC